jgi:hypothetical protein
MFTLEESALLRRMLQVTIWLVIGLGVAALLFVTHPWSYFLTEIAVDFLIQS